MKIPIGEEQSRSMANDFFISFNQFDENEQYNSTIIAHKLLETLSNCFHMLLNQFEIADKTNSKTVVLFSFQAHKLLARCANIAKIWSLCSMETTFITANSLTKRKKSFKYYFLMVSMTINSTNLQCIRHS